MPAPPTAKPGATRRLEINTGLFAVHTHMLGVKQIGHLFMMLMAEVGERPVPAPMDRLVRDAYLERSEFSRIKGGWGRASLRPPLRHAVYERDKGVCRYCSRLVAWDDYHCDHVQPVSKGGSDDMRNLATSCQRCNRSKGAKPLSMWLQS